MIFALIGLKVFKTMFFDNMPRVWYKSMPYPEILIVVIDAMSYARTEGDLIKEELLWYFLVDVMRNPAKLKDFTQDYNRTRLDNLKKYLTK